MLWYRELEVNWSSWHLLLLLGVSWFHFCCCDKYLDYKQLSEEKVYLANSFSYSSLLWRDQCRSLKEYHPQSSRERGMFHAASFLAYDSAGFLHSFTVQDSKPYAAAHSVLGSS